VVDVVLALKGGAGIYNVNGGTTVGGGAVGTVDPHILTTDEIPAITLNVLAGKVAADPGTQSIIATLQDDASWQGGLISTVGSGGIHAHGFSVTNNRPAAACGTLQYLDL
jgi:hypothetical protein